MEDSKPAALPYKQAGGSSNNNNNNNHHQDDDHDNDQSNMEPDGMISSMPLVRSMNEDDVQRREERRRKRRRMKNHMRSQGNNPLFTNFLASNFDVKQNDEVIVIQDDDDDKDDDEEDPEEEEDHGEKPLLVIDVDVELGLKEEPQPPSPRTTSVASATLESPRITTRAAKKLAPTIAASSHFNIHTENQQSNSPLDEGWYEGVVSPMAMPEDEGYLNAVHCFDRQHLEFFSATGDRSSRKKRGRVGIRCRHCYRLAKDDPDFSWPTGSLSYPNTFASVHQACAQRFQVHWQTLCPAMAPEIRATFQALLEESQDPTRPSKRSRGGLPAPTYYTLSMQRIGLVETRDGLRFSRDLKLEPLPLETVKATMEAQNSGATADDYHHGSAQMEVAGSTPAAGASVSDAAMKEIRGQIDESAERVLADCIAEADQPDKYLARGSDKALVTDYIFVTIRQMALCHALPADLSSRGKKTKMMQMGLAGFCCRFCQEAAGGVNVFVQHSCRSFLSAPDNLGSAITNSFTQHLQKCANTPKTVQKAMGVFKRIHQRQMGLLPYGAQRRFFHLLWDRLREADKTEEEMQAILPSIQVVPNTPSVPAENVHDTPVEKAKPSPQTSNGFHSVSDNTPPERPGNFPETNDEETRKVLQEAEAAFAEKRAEATKYILLPEERNLVSDYVFLTLMQLRPAAPTLTDTSRNRRVGGGLMGVCCIHCAGSDQAVTPSGRSFPSAPDNFASALNTSLYNHMQSCYFISPELKRALVNLRKLHSSQCSSLRFGSQRKFFNLLFVRLRSLYNELDPSDAGAVVIESKETLESLGFIKINSSTGQAVYTCKRCRMVPAAFRARDAVCYDRLSLGRARIHNVLCQEDGLDLTLALSSFGALAKDLGQDPSTLIKDPTFQNLVFEAVGRRPELKRALVDDVQALLESDQENGSEVKDDKSRSERRRGIWKQFSHDISSECVDSAFHEFALSIGITSKLVELPNLVDYLMVISPSLTMPDMDCDLQNLNGRNTNKETTENETSVATE